MPNIRQETDPWDEGLEQNIGFKVKGLRFKVNTAQAFKEEAAQYKPEELEILNFIMQTPNSKP